MMIDALGPEIAAVIREDPGRITFARGMIQNLYLEFATLTKLPALLFVERDLFLCFTRLSELPDDLHVGGTLALDLTPITREAALRILVMPGLSDRAKISALYSAGYDALAAEAERRAGWGPDGRAPR
jgi:hypothetical protein